MVHLVELNRLSNAMEKGDLIGVAPLDNLSYSDNKESSTNSLDGEWVKYFDVTEEDILAAQQEADDVEVNEKLDGWENWN